MFASNSRSPSSSPVRKRQRLSSPTYDDQLGDLSQEHLDAFDALDARLSQSSQVQSGQINDASTLKILNTDMHSNSRTLGVERSMLKHPAFGLEEDPDNPFDASVNSDRNREVGVSSPSALPLAGFSRASALPKSAFASAATLSKSGFASASDLPLSSQEFDRALSPETPALEPDYDAWFKPVPVEAPSLFTTAKFASAALIPQEDVIPAVGFLKASHKGVLEPSSAALNEARKKMNEIWSEPTENLDTSMLPTTATFKSASLMTSDTSPKRPALRAMINSLNTPSTPSPAPSRLQAGAVFSPLEDKINRLARQKPFKSPLIKFNSRKQPSDAPTYTNSPLNPTRLAGPSAFTSASQLSSASRPTNTTSRMENPVPGPSAFTTPLRSTGLTPRTGRAATPFITPFKSGMQPGQPARQRLEASLKATPRQQQTPISNMAQGVINEGTPHTTIQKANRHQVFDLTPIINRKSLCSSGLIPGQYSNNDLELMGINSAEISQMTPSLAIYYSFHTASTSPILLSSPSTPTILGPTQAFQELLDRGCSLATKAWVDNHWCLILWKLSGMVALDPARESDAAHKRWCWAEVIRQLLYRYERELNGGSRPALRLVSTQDAPAALPMVLCVSGVTWSEGGRTDDGHPIDPHPELEVTDGWYRMRAEVDAAMARAVRRGIICVGRKIGVAGARLSSEKKDPVEILEAYNSTKLVLSGNSSHLSAWHAKLGFQRGPYVSTLHSLTADGGPVAVMDIVVVKTYPIAFLEFMVDENGQKQREGPRNEAEEAKINEQWKRRRENEASKLHTELDKKLGRFGGYIERLERRAGSQFRPAEDASPPDYIDNMYDELEDPAEASRLLSHISANDAGWLARHVRHRLETDREKIGEEIEQELQHVCPPREVRSFRILIVQDARTCRRPANRTAQLTVWDVLSLTLSEGSVAGSFEIGHRYLHCPNPPDGLDGLRTRLRDIPEYEAKFTVDETKSFDTVLMLDFLQAIEPPTQGVFLAGR